MLWLFFDIRGTPNCQVVRDHLFWWNRHMCHGQKTVFFLVYGHPTIRDVGHINPYSCTHPIWLWRCQPETYSSVGILVPSSQNYPHHPSPKWAKMGQNGPKWVRSRACNRPTCHSPTSFASGPSTYHRPEPNRRGHHKIAISGRKSPENLARISEYQNLSIVSIILSLEMQNLSWLW